jgi:uncharacterized protein YbjT (DUF2867 family)
MSMPVVTPAEDTRVPESIVLILRGKKHEIDYRAWQPIGIDDLIAYLVAALRLPVSDYRIYEIGGADQVSYADIMRAYARQRAKVAAGAPRSIASDRTSPPALLPAR